MLVWGRHYWNSCHSYWAVTTSDECQHALVEFFSLVLFQGLEKSQPTSSHFHSQASGGAGNCYCLDCCYILSQHAQVQGDERPHRRILQMTWNRVDPEVFFGWFSSKGRPLQASLSLSLLEMTWDHAASLESISSLDPYVSCYDIQSSKRWLQLQNIVLFLCSNQQVLQHTAIRTSKPICSRNSFC